MAHLKAELKQVLSLERNAWEKERTSLQSELDRLHHEAEQNDSVHFAALQKIKNKHESELAGLHSSFKKTSRIEYVDGI